MDGLFSTLCFCCHAEPWQPSWQQEGFDLNQLPKYKEPAAIPSTQLMVEVQRLKEKLGWRQRGCQERGQPTKKHRKIWQGWLEEQEGWRRKQLSVWWLSIMSALIVYITTSTCMPYISHIMFQAQLGAFNGNLGSTAVMMCLCAEGYSRLFDCCCHVRLCYNMHHSLCCFVHQGRPL